MGLLKGAIYITEDINVVNTADLRTTKIIDLDEDSEMINNPSVIKGVCLLPPPEAKIAEVDNNEQLYDMAYFNSLMENYQQHFVAALLAYLYTGGNLIIYLPEMGYTYTKEKLIQMFWKMYGIHIGEIGNPDPNRAGCYYDESCIPIWLQSIYLINVMTPEAFLYPNATIDAGVVYVEFGKVVFLLPLIYTLRPTFFTTNGFSASAAENVIFLSSTPLLTIKV
jgi:hypothetical protein